MTAPRRLQLRRGNSTAVSTYTGAAGEVVIDTTNWTLRVHDGVTQGGYVVTANTTSLNANITQANLGLKGYVDLANTIQSQQISAANLGMKGYVDSVASQSIYGNSNVKSYFTEGFDGNIIPSANVTYSLGSLTRQWKDLFVSNNTIYVGGVPLTIDATGNLTINGNTIPTVAYVNTAVANVTVDLSSYALNANVTAANLGLKGYVDQANTIQSSQLSSANLGIIGYVDNAVSTANLGIKGYVDNSVSTANIGIKGYVDNQTYTNVNVTSYLVAETNKNIHGNVTVYGNLTVNGNISYINVNNYVVSDNIINLADANPGDSLDLGFSAHRTVATTLEHTGLIRDASANQWKLFSNVTAQPGTTIDFTNAIYDAVQVGAITSPTIDTINNNIAAANAAIAFANSIQSQQLSAANVGIIGYIDLANSIQSQQITAANTGMKGYVDSLTYSNVQVATYLPTYSGSIAANISKAGYTWTFGSDGTLTLPTAGRINFDYLSISSYSDVSTFYAPSGNVQLAAGIGDAKIVTNSLGSSKTWTFGTDGNLTLPGNVTAINYANGSPVSFSGGSNYSNVQVATYLPTYTGTLAGGTLNLAGQDGTTVADFQTGAATNQIITLSSDYTFSIKAGDGAGNRGHLVLESGRNSRVKINGNGSNVLITAGNGTQSSTWTFANSGVLTFPDGTTQSTAGGAGSNYGNVNVKAYTESMGFQNYGNSNVTAYLNATGYNLYSNVNVAAYLSTATINTTGNITAQNLTGNISITGNVTGTSANVTLQAGAYTSVFDNQGNVRLPTAYITGNVTASYFIGNGSQLTGLPSSYSNVQVATYLPTYSGNIANIRLGVSGVLTFADGTTQTTAGGGSYSNVQVAAYLTTGVNTAAPQIQLTNATSNFIKYNNVGVGAPTFTTSNVGTRIIYWSSVDANTADYAVGIDAGVLWHGIPRATSGFAFKWYGGTTQIAMLEGTGLFTVANIKLSPSGNIMFADGTIQTTAATGSYSNIQVATYLPTYTGSLNASNILVTSANITVANIQTTTAATNTATGALRVMGGVGVAGTVFAGQFNTTGNLIANAISAYSLNTVANVVASVVRAGTINSAGNVLAQNIIGTIATASQTGITAVGTLETLTVSGNVTSSNFVGSTPNVQLIANTSITTFDVYGNVTFPGNNVISSLGITMPTRPAFRVNGTSLYAGAQSTANVNLKGVAVSTQYNQGNYFDATTGKFTAPVAGIYEVLLNSRVNSSYNGLAQLVVLKNGLNTSGNIVAFWETTSNAAGATHFGVSGTVVLATGDYLSANILSGNITFDQNDNWSVTYLG